MTSKITVPLFLFAMIAGPGLLWWLTGDDRWLLGYVLTLILILAG